MDKEYHRAKAREHYKNNKERYKAYMIQRRREHKRKLVEHLGGKCSVCGYDKCIWALEFHHTDPEQKNLSLASCRGYKWERLLEEVEQCVLVCSNCHRELEAKSHGF